MQNSAKSKKLILAVSSGAVINLILFFIKLYIGLSVNSIAIYADALNSLADSAVCIAAITGFALLTSKSSKKFPFGTGKTEELIELLISVIILVSGCAFAFISFERLLYPVPVWYSSVYAVIIAATAFVKLALMLFFKAASKKLDSDIIKGFSTDSLLDFFITLCTFLSFTLSESVNFSVDGTAGIIISIILIVQGIKQTVTVCGKISGKRNDIICENAKRIIESDCQVEKVTDIQCHIYGENKIFTAIIIPNCKSAEEMTALSKRLSKNLNEKTESKLYLSFGGKDEK